MSTNISLPMGPSPSWELRDSEQDSSSFLPINERLSSDPSGLMTLDSTRKMAHVNFPEIFREITKWKGRLLLNLRLTQSNLMVDSTWL
ncbi:hypothetical protein QCA50_002379 [Cerrena zonata]|uniref:Uncharacterized protein n=1 Tax=Cerrena zonata TaxID=2478898 RepID=A0AAW0GTH6_9APHY